MSAHGPRQPRKLIAEGDDFGGGGRFDHRVSGRAARFAGLPARLVEAWSLSRWRGRTCPGYGHAYNFNDSIIYTIDYFMLDSTGLAKTQRVQVFMKPREFAAPERLARGRGASVAD